MKAKSTFIVAFLVLALLVLTAPTRAEAQCCWGDAIAAPFVAAGAIVEGAVVVSAAIVTAPITALSCGSCGVSLCNPCGFSACNPCGSPPVSYVPGDYGRY
jgi:hypothetical protein